MERSSERILTTHVGALQRPAELSQTMLNKGEDSPEARAMLKTAVADVVGHQVATGIDVVNDGEFGKTLWMWYVRDRLGGIDSRDWSKAEEAYLKGRDREQFDEFYSWADANQNLFGYMEDAYFFSPIATQPVVTGPLTYRPEAVQRDIENLQEAIVGENVTEAFMPVVAPASVEVGVANEYYSSRDELMRALADAMREEYQAIIDAGFILQVDDAGVPAQWDRRPELDLDEYRRYARESIEVLNHALAGLPEDRIRYHICWGSWHGPHKHDVALADIVDLVLEVRAQAYLIESANARHEHEYHVWENVELPGQDSGSRGGHAPDQRPRASRADRGADNPVRGSRRPRERHRRCRLRLRQSHPPADRLGQVAGAHRGCGACLSTTVEVIGP